MKHALSITVGFAVMAVLGCSTPPPHSQPSHAAVPTPDVQFDLPPEQREMFAGRVCKLGTSCMDLDPRPFEACLVGAKHCVDKALETVEVEALKPRADPEPLETVVRSPARSPAPSPAR
jgi:hypothetical protein